MSERSVSRRSAEAQHGFFQRANQLQALLDALDNCIADGDVRFVTVTGEAGLGKTRFLIEFENRLADDPAHASVRVAYGRAMSARSVTSAFLPIREALVDLVGDEKTKASRVSRVFSALRETAPDWLGAIPTVGGVLEAATRTARQVADSGDPQSQPLGESMNRQFMQFVESVVEEAPLVLLLDDLHWADASSLDLLLYLAETLRSGPMLVVMAYRDDDSPVPEGGRELSRAIRRLERYLDVEHVELTRLDASGIAEIIADTVSADPSAPVVQWLLERSDGNPLFLHEYLGLIRDRGLPEEVLIEPDDHQLDALSNIPRRIEGILGERLDYLDDEQLRVLQVASTLGPAFAIDDVIALSDLTQDRTRSALRALSQRANLIRPVRPLSGDDPVTSYSFFHNLVASYVAEQIEEKDPYDYGELHRRCAEYLVERNPSDPAQLQEIASHFHIAKSHENALPYCLDAARAAARIGAVKEAERLYAWAVSHAKSLSRADASFCALVELGWTEQQLGKTISSLRTLQEAERNLESASASQSDRAALRLQLAKACRMLSMWVEAREYLALAQAELPEDSPERLAEASLFAGELALCGRPSSPEEALAQLSRGLEYQPDPGLRSAIQGHVGLTELVLDHVPKASAWLHESLVSAKESGSPYRIYEAHHWLSKLQLACVDLDAAGHAIDAMQSISDESGVFTPNPFHLRDSGRRYSLSNDVDLAVAKYVAYVARILPDESLWTRTWVQLALQCEELAGLHGPAAAERFSDTVLSALRGSNRRLLDICPPLREIAEALRDDYALLLDGDRALAPPDEIADMRRVFDFDVPDLSAFRTRHAFYRVAET